ncbi:hypothetical protein pEaSNUABM37_00168 [Erwinia phage pEa_SNUABM_37]|nr:hypothetical protein pEaSNUABM37_00168 [Erwinia phage pEa_SNUABM_37]QXO10638.1 hypothetical protein pEaSNUABM48_00168 [Erwinia phage pEa_SNUABM_48]
MADNFELDFGDFSPDFDLDYDFGGSNSGQQKKPKKKGEVIKEFTSGLWEGFSDGMTGYGVPQRLIKSMLPRSYGPAMDSVDRTLRFKDDLYDKVRENTKEAVAEFKGLTREALGAHGKKVPEKLAKRLEDWANSSSSEASWRDYVSKDEEGLDIDSDSTELLDAFTHGSAASAELSQAQHEELMATLAAGAVSNQKDTAKQSILLDQIVGLQRRLVGFNENFTSTFQRRSLELQYRHYKLDISIAKMQEQYYKRSLEAFSGLVANSAKTEIEKANQSTNHQKLIRKNYGGGALKSTFSRYGNHLYDSMYGLVDNASQNANNRWASTAGGIAAAMRSAQQARMSGAMSGARNRGAMIGGMAASAMPFLLQQLVRSRMERSGAANGLGHNLSYYAESAPGLVNGWLRNRKQFDEHYNEFDPNNKWYTRLQKGVLNPLMNNALFSIPITQGNKTRVSTPGIKDLTQPAQWDMMQRRTLVEVIPGLLTQQLTVQQKLYEVWGGEAKPEEAFNHKQGAFTTKARVKADIRSSIFNRNEFQSAAGSFNGMVETLDPDEELSPNARVALAMRFARDADAGDGFNINNYLGESGWVNTDKDTIREINDFLHARFKTKEATGKAKAFGKFQIGDGADVAELRKKVATNMQSQMNYMPDVQESVNALANGGQRAMLKEMGIIQRINGQEVFNHDMYWDMMKKFIANPNFRPDLEEGADGEKKRELTDRVDTGAIDELKNKAKDKLKGKADDLGLTDVASNARDRVNDVLGRGKDAAGEATRRLRETMTKEALNKLFDTALDKYDDLVSQLQRLARSGSEVDIRAGIAEVKERAEASIRHIRKQLAGLDREALGEEAYKAATERAEEIIQSLNRQIDTLNVGTLRSGIESGPDAPAPNLADSKVLDTGSKQDRSITPSTSTPIDEEPSAELTVASETNELLKELISISASSRDQIAAAKDATIAQITGDPQAINNGTEERKGFLKSLGTRMKSYESGKYAKVFGLAKLYNSGVVTLTKWATIGPAIVGWKGAKMLYKFFRKKKDGEVGDVDGDGIRENSWMDRLRRKKEKLQKEKVDKDGVPKEKPTSLFGMLGGIFTAVTGMFSGFKKHGILGGLASFLGLGWVGDLIGGIGSAITGLGKLIMGKKALETASDALGDVGDVGGDERKGKRGRGRRGRGGVPKKRGFLNRMARKVVGGTARAIKNEPGRMAGRASWLIKGGAKTLARRIPMVGAVGLGAFEMYESYKDNDGLGMADSAGGMAGGLAGAAAGAAIGSVVPIVGTFIGGVVGGALGAMGGSSIGSALYKWIRSPGPLQQMRLYQYGLDSINGDFTGKIFNLEQACLKYVKVTDSGKAMLDPKLPMAELARPFIENPDSRDEVESFGGWFVQRFKPVFLTHVAVAKQLFPGVDFMNLDDSKDAAAKYEMAKRCQQFDESIDHPYRWTGVLFNTQPAMNYEQTTEAVQGVVEKLKKELKSADKNAKSTSIMTLGNEDKVRAESMDKGVVDAIKPMDGSKLKGANLDGHTVSGGWGQEVTVVSVQDVLGKLLPKKGEPLDDLTAARMKIYGLNNLDISKVSVLLQLELVMQNRITFNGRGCHFSGKTKEVFDVMASSFGHGWLSIGAFNSWSKWFSRRFLPAYLAFATTVKNQVGDDQPTMAAANLPPETKLMIIQSMTGQTYNDGRNELSIWTVADNPWSDSSTSNTDATILDVHINNLKQLAKQAQYEAKPVKGGIKQSEDGTTDKDWRKDNSTGQQATNAVRGTDGLVRSSQRQETLYDPKTGQTNGSYGGGQFGDNKGAAASGSGGGLDTTGKVEPLKMGPGTEEGVRAMIREAAKNGITDKKELAIMLANTHHETGGFKNVEENLRYKPQTLMKLWPHRFPTMDKASQVASGGPVTVANTIYGNRMGNDQPGDGWKYRGRGFIQLTGKDNYTRASKALGVDLVDDPDAVAEDPTMAAASALYFWKANKNIGEKAKAGDVAGVRKIVNGGTIGLEDTQKLASQYAKMLDGGEYDDILSGKDKGDTGTTSEGGDSMEDLMGQSAQEQAAQQGVAATPQPGSENANTPAAKPPGSETNAAPAAGESPTPPTMTSTTGPSAKATDNATSVTPNAPDSSASADPDALNKSSLQTQQSAPSANSTVNPVPVTMQMDDTHAKSTAQNTATTNEKLDQMIDALNKIAGSNQEMAEKEVAPATAQAAPAPASTQKAASDFRSAPIGQNNANVSFQRSY